MEGGMAAAIVAVIFYGSVILIFLSPILLIAVAVYVVNGISMMKISKKLGVARGWLAFIPFANYWQLGRLAEEDRKLYAPEKKPVKWSALYLVAMIAVAVIAGILGGIKGGVTSVLSMNGSEGAAILTLGVELIFYFFNSLLTLATTVLTAVVFYKIYHRMAGKSAIWMTLLSVFVPFAQTVLLVVLAFSKKYPVAVPVKGPAEPLEVSAQDATAEPFKAQDEPLEHPEVPEQ
jgi:hypothetical protein